MCTEIKPNSEMTRHLGSMFVKFMVVKEQTVQIFINQRPHCNCIRLHNRLRRIKNGPLGHTQFKGGSFCINEHPFPLISSLNQGFMVYTLCIRFSEMSPCHYASPVIITQHILWLWIMDMAFG